MSVIQARASRLLTALAGFGLVVAGGLLRGWLAFTTVLSGLLEVWGQRVESARAKVSLAAARQARATDRWRAAFEAAPLGMGKVGLDGRLEAVNSALRTLLGGPDRAIVGRRLSSFVYPDDLATLGGPGNPGLAPKGVARAEVRVVCAGGRLRWCEIASSLVRDEQDRAEYVLISVVDITRHKRSQAALRDLATRDPLSGLANRRWFELQLAQHLRLCADEGPRGALVLIDLDHFKQVNDNLGHPAGDRLVIEVAVTLRRHLRDQDVVARLGGDEFAVILRDGDRAAAEAVARKLVLAVRDEVRADKALALPIGAGADADAAAAADADADADAEVEVEAIDVRSPSLATMAAGRRARVRRAVPAGEHGLPEDVTVSVGVAPFELLAPSTDLDSSVAGREALKMADAAMYAVKRSGRNGYAMAGTDDGPHHARRRAEVPDLSIAAARVGEAARR
ncbi:MAG TPA: sensor domain-containing diguanylate cyclase [Acidimicrobiales bacterium]|nr:sensor domain-containing diguanylate cyclase [Acidimicrobiales bacterium]